MYQSCTTLYQQNNTLNTNKGGNIFTIAHPDGRVLCNDNSIIRLNSGEPINFTKYNGNDVFKNNSGRFGLFSDGHKQFALRHASRVLYLSPFKPYNLDFSWYFIESPNGTTIYNDYISGQALAYNNDEDYLYITRLDDPNIVSWNISYINNGTDDKNKFKALAIMDVGQGRTSKEDAFSYVNTCVLPRETLSMLKIDRCNLNESQYVPTKHGYLDLDPNIANSQIVEGKGVYPTRGCALPFEDETFQWGVDNVANAIAQSAKDDLDAYKTNIANLFEEIKNISSVVIPNKIVDLKNIKNKLMAKKVDCDKNKQKIPALKTNLKDITDQLKPLQDQLDAYNRDWVPGYKALGEYYAQKCNDKYNTGGSIKGINGTCMDIKNWSKENGKILNGMPCDITQTQKWMMDDQNRIISMFNGKCLDVLAADRNPGTAVVQWDCHDGNNQKWDMDKYNRLHPRHAPDVCLDLWAGAPGERMTVYPCHGGANQKWGDLPRGKNFNFSMSSVKNNINVQIEEVNGSGRAGISNYFWIYKGNFTQLANFMKNGTNVEISYADGTTTQTSVLSIQERPGNNQQLQINISPAVFMKPYTKTTFTF